MMKDLVRVLHVDDNRFDRQLVRDALMAEHDRFVLTEAEDQEELLACLESMQFDVILSDFNILGFSGLQVLEIVKQKQPETPVIIVTGTGSEEVAIKAMKMGASDYVIKSARHIRGLASAIDLVIENRKLIAERETSRINLQKSEEKYRKIFENIQDVYYQIDSDGVIIEMSPSIYKISGFKREELIGKQSEDFYEDPEFRNVLLELLAEKHEVWDFEIRLRTKTGELRWASVNVHLLLDENSRPIGIEGSMRDIEGRKKMEADLLLAIEKAKGSDRLKTAFLQNISHEIRTPLNAIVGFTNLLCKSVYSPEKSASFANVITHSSQQLLSIIDSIVLMANIESGQENINEKSFGLKATFRLLFEQFLSKADSRKIILTVEPLPEGDEIYISADETKFIQVLVNLIDNALKFTEGGVVLFGYTLKEEEIEFFVKDTGMGIPADMQKIIFERFSKLDNPSGSNAGGSGLGLSISKAYVELMGGRIWVESEVGKGSSFYFTIPLKKIEKDQIFKEDRAGNIILNPGREKTILVVEDDDSNFFFLDEILRSEYVSVIRAADGAAAVEICRNNPGIDLVLMDIKLPVLDGIEATRRIREFLPELPVIAQTAYASSSEKYNAIAAGCSDYLSKPIDVELLISRVNNYLK